ncbi:MAG: hypothetical protein ACHQ53_04580 [Polyangiales bacterium]
MTRAAQALRSALEEFLAGEQAALLQRLRDPGDDAVPRSRGRGDWLASEHGAEALEEACGAGALSTDEVFHMQRHIDGVRHARLVLPAEARLRRSLVSASLPSGERLGLPELLSRLARADDGRRRGALGRELEQTLKPIALEHVSAHARAEAPLRVAPPPPSDAAERSPTRTSSLIVSAWSVEALTEPRPHDLPEPPWLDPARAFLRQTEDAAQDAVRHCLRAFDPGKRIDWHLLLRGLRAPELDSAPAAKQRWQRAAAFLRVLGFERELDARMRAEVDRGGALPFASVVQLALPRDVRVAQIAIDHGVASDAFAAQAVAEALGLALVQPALPPELRWPCGASVAGALGALALQLHGDRVHLTRVQGLTAAEAERVGRLSGTLALLHTRAWVALALCPPPDAERPEAQLEALAEALSAALCCELPEALGGVLGANRVRARARAEEALAGLCLHVALRQRFDADWFRNPRSAELLRDACTAGNLNRPAALCDALGSPLTAASPRACELVT